MKLEVGMYVRTKNGKITKILSIDEIALEDGTRFYETELNEGYCDLNSEDITKASHNIIDLIEVGDYVNGEKVGYIDDLTGTMRQFNYDYEDETKDCGHYEEEIETILTKEQFKNNCYKISEEMK